MLWLIAFALSLAGLGWELRRRRELPTMDPGLFATFQLRPGERHGAVWPAAATSGAPMLVTITSDGALLLSDSNSHEPPLRFDAGGAEVTVDRERTVTYHPKLPMVQVTIAAAGASPVTVYLPKRVIKAVTAWAKAKSNDQRSRR